MKDVFISIRGRVLLNAEALNMTESVGNYVKHRRVPMMLKEEDGSYAVYFVPAISGESIAHGLQVAIAEKAKENNLPVCKLCGKGIFLKSSNKKIFQESFGQNVDEDKVEETVIKNCVVEDIGGFLYAEETNVKRTSNFYTGYMVPTYEGLKNVVIEPQLHSRYALGTKFVKEGQMIYYVEVSSSPYTFSLDIDTRFIGKLTFDVERAGQLVVGDAKQKRVEVLLDATQSFLIENGYGAKKTRFLPLSEWESMVVAVSDKVWTVPSPFTKDYIEKAKKKLSKISNNTDLHVYERDGEKSFEEFVADVIESVKKRIK
ncbi:MAG: type I-A CRISPR-associated protein Cas7/Csa2 [Candidatus Terraquivivens tikiterensis]|uniref:Type I-A CRISPR-associated protein Cas7/Csa2 n=1 Tax=Candidatus Terraquivivens tikiterensis TaxID=1980982 RepID=A0A2R7Y535_9ARCH|nr:MAG: type I-A CRISPR-associated protein Cas7/Csa2 [Candidatus Terraquivivens tikiterensis]